MTYKNGTYCTGIKMGPIILVSKWDLLYWYQNGTYYTGIKMGLIVLVSKLDLLYWYQNGTYCTGIKMALIVLLSKWDLLYWYQNGTYCTGIKVFDCLPTHIKNISHNVNQFTLALRNFLPFCSFYNLEEYFNSSSNLWT